MIKTDDTIKITIGEGKRSCFPFFISHKSIHLCNESHTQAPSGMLRVLLHVL
ncbi:hypothetical protein LX92_01605 [Maribacter polysiphoniae]|uniref:Uncharacterized protein n=1 Tax=Maribacter polysiphoniae TaxID=429344 RepID=A0A316E3S1_9FLAO|nr:hypothetical protein LX92_01605 [Maribacter polysiphoniae]